MPDREGDVAAAYERESLARCREGARLGSLLGILLIGTFAALDRVRFPELFPTLLSIRAGAVLFLVIGWRLTTSGRLAHYVRLVGACSSILIGLIFDALMIFTGGPASPYYAGASLVILGANLMVPWGPIWAAIVSGEIIAGYIVCAILGDVSPARGHLFLNNLFYMSGTGVIAVFISAMSERLRWREFRTRHDLQEAYRHKSEFFANISHELRTPIHVMIGYADILLEEALEAGGPEARRLVEGSRNQGVVLNRLISDLLDYSKLEAGKMEVVAQPVAIAEAIQQIDASFRPVAERKGLRLSTSVQRDCPMVLSDPRRLQQVLTNLVGNAIKFTETGGVRIEVMPATVLAATIGDDLVMLGGSATVGRSVTRATVAVAIGDTGIGIHADDLATLGADFHQLDGAERYGGTGLGLSYSRKLIALLGGAIGVRSRPGEGATFVIFLPAADAPAGEDSAGGDRHSRTSVRAA